MPCLWHGDESPVHGLVACGGEDGFLECFDLRQKTPVGRINAVGLGNEHQVMDYKDLLHSFESCFGMGFPTWSLHRFSNVIFTILVCSGRR